MKRDKFGIKISIKNKAMRREVVSFAKEQKEYSQNTNENQYVYEVVGNRNEFWLLGEKKIYYVTSSGGRKKGLFLHHCYILSESSNRVFLGNGLATQG